MSNKKTRSPTLLEIREKDYKIRRSLTGFTLQEFIIIIVIIGILAALALPQFGITRERALVKEAITNLKLIAAAEKIYRMEIGDYYLPGETIGDIAAELLDINTNLKLFLNEKNWDYAITVPAVGGSFTAGANRTEGTYLDCEYSINNATDEPTPVVPANCP